MTMEQVAMPMDTTKYNKLMDNTFSKYRPPYFWARYRSFFTFQNVSFHTSGQDMTYSSEVHDKGDPFSKLLE